MTGGRGDVNMRTFKTAGNEHYDLSFDSYVRKTPVRAARVQGPFSVETSEGTMTCQDGWLAFDTKGNRYPIADEVFQDTYELAKEGATT